jgi:hypothetical protein
MATTRFCAKLLLAGALLFVPMAADLAAAPCAQLFAPAVSQNVAPTPTTDVRDAMATYLAPHSRPSPRVVEFLLADPPAKVSVAAYNAPPQPASAGADPMPPAQLAYFAYPEVTGLAGAESDERAIPFGSTAFLSMGPGGFGRVMTGRCPGVMSNWTQATETAMSYVRPHVNVQMMLAFEVPLSSASDGFEGPGMEPHAYLAVDHIARVDSAEIGTATDAFGFKPRATPVEEGHTALAAGLDLGLLPTFLSQMGLNVSVVASRGTTTGNLTVALVGTTELPVDWAPHERPWQHPTAVGVEPLQAQEGRPYPTPSGSVSGSRGDTPSSAPPKPFIPITPTVPEPMTLTLLGLAATALLAHRRRLARF